MNTPLLNNINFKCLGIKWLVFVLLVSFIPNALAGAFTLSSNCPAYFQLDSENTCRFVSLYASDKADVSSSPSKQVNLTLPKARDGFTPQQIDLGRYLFFDPLLSDNNKLACAHCHLPNKAFTDGSKTAVGIHGEKTPLSRNTPSLWNVTFLSKLFWDGRASSLEDQLHGPLFNEDEMGNKEKELLDKLNDNKHYPQMFREAFLARSSGVLETIFKSKISTQELLTALSAFESSLISLNSSYDQYVHFDKNALSHDERKGLATFGARCYICHTPPLFTNQELVKIGAPETQKSDFKSGNSFKVPSLRNVALTGPYMHSGTLETLEDLMDFYNHKPGHALGKKASGTQLHWYLADFNLNPQETKNLIAFLKSLTDQSTLPVVPENLPSGLQSLN